MKKEITESFLSLVWKNQWLEREALRTTTGERVEVVHPGWENKDSGPDFSDALIYLDGEPLKGDVELHTTAKEWWGHGHHKDPEYNRVILHVVWKDGGSANIGFNGGRIPTLALQDKIELLPHLILLADEPCHKGVEGYGADRVARVLDEAGERRFHNKVAQFKAKLTTEEAGQGLYQGIMRALGYAKNKEAFEELARRLPLGVLEGVKDYKLVQALLLGTAGLLPRQRRKRDSDPWSIELERIWDSLGIGETMNESDWRFFRVRPENFPTRRLVAAGYLLLRYGKGLLQEMLRLVSQESHSRLEQGFMVTTDGYWASHFDFGVEGWNRSLIGRGRAREIVVNILLPFSAAWGEINFQPYMSEKAMEIYRTLPPPWGNRITRFMMEKLGTSQHRLIYSAQRHQGLIHLYNHFCRRQLCRECPLTLTPA